MPPPTTSAKSSALFTAEDATIAFNVFCCVCGIGSLGMPSNYARAGWVYATIALLFMAFANIYASVLLSKCLLVAPSSVRTYSDLGEWVAGRWGRLVVLVSQMGVCLLMPCAFLVLGSTLLDVLFPDCFSQAVWIVFMALTVVPVSLVPTMKESTGMAVAGCLGTIVADIVGIAILFHGMRGHPSPPAARASGHQVVTTFGNLSLAYAAATVVPDLQRQHSQPERMPRVIIVSLGLASAFFIAVAVSGYALGGCQMSGNLLFSIVNTADPFAVTTLGFTADRGAVVMAFLFMQMHLAVAFSTLLHPAFYMFERMFLGMHAPGAAGKKDETASYRGASTPAELEQSSRASRAPHGLSRVSATNTMVPEEDLSEYKGRANVLRYIVLRIAIIALLVLLSILLRNHFLDLVDFTGATAITMSSLVAPLVFYNKVFWKEIPLWEKAMCLTVATICTIAGCYVMVYSGKNLFNPSGKSAAYPYCSAEFQDEPYYVRNNTT
ncbi:unnamed protein product [Hyaloperonospora brassicae]|uniref:Amino acid transporter transmembrane domain-containing protein n=1 Tax=Hyaloperonospora brassicae TaxID=162125 RepID=A0AAV0TL16_HYABA|nr:unnamed protein product [Hyaloperonospora brassicae]